MRAPESELHAWFVREVLPLEAALTGFLRNNRQSPAEIADLLQGIYERVYEAASTQLPVSTKPFVFTIAHNLLVDQVRRKKVIPLSTVENLDALGIAAETPGPEETTIAREELRRLQEALERVPPRSREAILLRQVEGLSRNEIASRMGIAEKTVKRHLNIGVRALAAILYGEPPVSRDKL
jgi:RNA polymerase sigma-70 factor (ECF subfamily)